mgnify:CR=1 FL=1
MTAENGQRDLDFLLLMEDYQGSFTDAFRADPALTSSSYAESARQLFSRPIYYGDAYPDALATRGFRADQVVPTCHPLQYKWAREHRIWNPGEWMTRVPGTPSPVRLAWQLTDHQVLRRILLKQIALRRPRIVWLFSGVPVTAAEVRAWRRHAEHILLWWSSPLRKEIPYREFDLILSGIPSLIRHFREQGIRAEPLAHAFDPRILSRVTPAERRVRRVAFVGSLSPHHLDRVTFLDRLSRQVPVDLYGHGERFLPRDSPLHRSFRGPAWGDDLYAVYGSHLIAVHRNIDVADRSASAKRLFEATGMGACVVTEESDNLKELFRPGEEIVTYSDLDDCIAKVEALLKEPERAAQIGKAGQTRTLADHTYGRRVEALVEVLRASAFL